MNRLRNFFIESYPVRVYRSGKTFFILVVVFFSGTILCNLKLLQVTPFFVWDMFSSPVGNANIEHFEIFYDGKRAATDHTWKSAQNVFILNQLRHYHQYTIQGDSYKKSLGEWTGRHPRFRPITSRLTPSREHANTFPRWFIDYLSAIKEKEISSVIFVKTSLQFENSSPVKVSSDTILKLP